MVGRGEGEVVLDGDALLEGDALGESVGEGDAEGLCDAEGDVDGGVVVGVASGVPRTHAVSASKAAIAYGARLMPQA